jgi:hypothetical protein
MGALRQDGLADETVGRNFDFDFEILSVRDIHCGGVECVCVIITSNSIVLFSS